MISEIYPSVWRASGSLPGPNIFLIGGTHGNERTGIEVIRVLRDRLRGGSLSLEKGTLTLAVGNVKAAEENVRYFDGRDLNRCFNLDRLAAPPDGTYEDARARELSVLIREADVTLDLHATNKPSVPFAASKRDAAHERVYRWFATEIVLTDPHYILGGEPATTDEYADAVGKIGICVETGQASDVSVLPRVLQALDGLLRDFELIAGPVPEPPPEPTSVYVLDQAIILTSKGFHFANGMGTHSFQSVKVGDIIGYVGEETLTAKKNGVILFPKTPEYQTEGKPVVYLASQMD
ncbi:MAG TPA: succinylglutamate desuccinylase/aspartoacylase family protein [Patescibacteria group bacterium]|nr:succinylglutamate desuccinylase/aspartoacylase family protein [Patescibacteria group bacterium]